MRMNPNIADNMRFGEVPDTRRKIKERDSTVKIYKEL